MIGNFYIDELNAYSSFRILLTQHSYKELLAFAPLKSVESNDWAEEDGAEFDLSAPVLDTRELNLNFAFHGNDSKFDSFFETLSDKAYHDFNFTEINKTYRLRLVSQPTMVQISTLGTFSLRFADDFPLADYEYVAPHSNLVSQRGYAIDGRDFSE
jgi:hypothetical protein